MMLDTWNCLKVKIILRMYQEKTVVNLFYGKCFILMEHRVTIKGTLPNMNDYTNAQRGNRYMGAKLKKDAQTLCAWVIRSQLKNIRIQNPVVLHYYYYEPNRKRDLDNIAGFAHKVIQDALVECGVLQNDGWQNIIGFTDYFEVDKANPRIELIIEERKPNEN